MKTIIATIIWVIFIIAVLLYMAGTQISFKPFSIKFNTLSNLFGWLFLTGALICFGFKDYSRGYNKGELKGYEEGLHKGSEMTVEAYRKVITNKLNELNKKNETKDSIK